MLKTKIILVTVGLLTAGSLFAATPKDGYSFNQGAKKSELRESVFVKARSMKDDDERKAFLESNRIGEGSVYADKERLDVNELLEAKIIDQKTADAIKDFASKKHGTITERFESMNFKDMTPAQVEKFHEDMKNLNLPNETVDDLEKNKLISKKQAELIREYIKK